MKTPSSKPCSKILLAVVLGWLLALVALPVSAADVLLKTNDASGTTSWTGSTNWSNGAVPGSANNYFTGPSQMRTPADNTAFPTFAGAFLSLDPGGSLNCKQNGNFTNSSLRLNGGTLWLGGGSVATNIVHYGAIVLNATTNSAIATDNSSRSVVFNSIISGSGSSLLLISNIAGGVTLAGANTFSNPILVTNASLLKAANAAALGTVAGATVVASGSTLDVNAQNLGAEPVIVGGAGIGNNGAIINSSSTGQNNALRYVTLTANTTFGGTGRWDIRNSGGGSLTGGGFTVTKVGANQVNLVDIGNTDLGDITINAGIFGFEVGTTMGRPANTLTLAGGTLQFYNSTVAYDKNFVFNGGTVNKTFGNTTLLSPITLGGTVTSNPTTTAAPT